jgi:hypothetical protein
MPVDVRRRLIATTSPDSVDLVHLLFAAEATAADRGPCPVNLVLHATGARHELSGAEAVALAEWLASGAEAFVHDAAAFERYLAEEPGVSVPTDVGAGAGARFILSAVRWLRSEAIGGAHLATDAVPASIRDDQLPFAPFR